MPWAPEPGGVAAEHWYMPGTPRVYGDGEIRGPKTNWWMSLAPVMMSRRTDLLGLAPAPPGRGTHSSSAVVIDTISDIIEQPRKPTGDTGTKPLKPTQSMKQAQAHS